MLIEKIFKKKSKLYENFRPNFVTLGKIFDKLGLIQLFSIWTIVVSGIVVRLHTYDRFTYFDWSTWVEGSVKLIFISLFFILFLFPKKLWLLGNKILNLKEILFHSALCFGMMIFGWISFSTLFESIYLLIPYYFAIVSCMFIFQFTLVLDANNGTWDVASWDKKQFNLTLSFLMMMVAVSLGIIFDDPMISTAAMVSSPYALIAIIWPKHVRHLQRARFYPVLTFSLFLCVRAPWFIVPLVILFFMLRTTNYFRFGIAYPSFAVDFLDKES